MRALPARANHKQSKTAADAFFLTVFDRRSDCRKAPAVRWRMTSNVWADFYIAFHSHGGFADGKFAALPGGIFEPTHPPTEVTPGLRPRPLTGALNFSLLPLWLAVPQLQGPRSINPGGAVFGSEPHRGGPAGPGAPLWAGGGIRSKQKQSSSWQNKSSLTLMDEGAAKISEPRGGRGRRPQGG